MKYRAKVTEFYPACKSLLVDCNPSYVHDRFDVYAEVDDLELATYLDVVNMMKPEQISAVLGLVSYIQNKAYEYGENVGIYQRR